MEVSPLGFTCTSSDAFSEEDDCKNVYNSDEWDGWFTKGDGKGSWIKISFNGNVRISTIIYRHNIRLPGEKFNQNFKDVSIRFSDETQLNLTLDDKFGGYLDRDHEYRLIPPKLSSYLELHFLSIYNYTHHTINKFSGKKMLKFEENKLGLSKLAVGGRFEASKYTGYRY